MDKRRGTEQQQNTVVRIGLITKQVSKLPSWKSPGQDEMVYWDIG